jgi:hypothetical protein
MLYDRTNKPYLTEHFVMGLSTVDQSRGGEFDVLASPVDQDTSVFDKFCGRNDVRTCLDVMLSGNDMIFTVSDKTESLVNFRLPNDGEFKQLVDEACDRLARTEVAYQVMRSNFRRWSASGPRMVCTSCGIVGADAQPNWPEQPARLSGARTAPWR